MANFCFIRYRGPRCLKTLYLPVCFNDRVKILFFADITAGSLCVRTGSSMALITRGKIKFVKQKKPLSNAFLCQLGTKKTTENREIRIFLVLRFYYLSNLAVGFRANKAPHVLFFFRFDWQENRCDQLNFDRSHNHHVAIF